MNASVFVPSLCSFVCILEQQEFNLFLKIDQQIKFYEILRNVESRKQRKYEFDIFPILPATTSLLIQFSSFSSINVSSNLPWSRAGEGGIKEMFSF